MKKTAAAILAATALLGMTACAPQLSTSETCVEIKALTSGLNSDTSEEDRQKAIDDMKELAHRASDSLKDELADGAELAGERLKDEKDQDRAKIEELEKRIESHNRISETCFK